MCYIWELKILKQIGAVFIVAIFLVSSVGIVLFETPCTCSGNKELSVFVNLETCEDNFYSEHHHSDGIITHEDEDNCNAFTNQVEDCGCSSPVVKFFKLKNQLADVHVRIVRIQAVKIMPASLFVNRQPTKTKNNIDESYNIDSPPGIDSSLDFLIQIQQLKISFLA